MKNTNKIKDFNTFCKEYVIDKLNDWKGWNPSYYCCDTAYKITEEPNVNGTFTFSRAEAMDYIKEWWDDAAEYWDYEKNNFGEHFHNPFDEPEAFTVCMLIRGVESLLSQCSVIDENWDEEITFTNEIIEKLLEELEDINIQW